MFFFAFARMVAYLLHLHTTVQRDNRCRLYLGFSSTGSVGHNVKVGTFYAYAEEGKERKVCVIVMFILLLDTMLK